MPLTIQKNLPARLAGLLCPLFLILICLAISLPRYRAGIDWSDEGFLAYGAVRVMEGQVPNRDFVSLQPPLSFYVAGGAFKVFGPSLATLRRLGLSIFVLMVLLIYALARSLVTPSLAFAAAFPAAILGLPYFNFTPFAVWQGITASLAAALLYLHAGLTNRRWLAFPAGMLAAISIFLRHDQGIYLAISILILAVALKFATNIVLARVLIFWFLGRRCSGTRVVDLVVEARCVARNVPAAHRIPPNDLSKNQLSAVPALQLATFVVTKRSHRSVSFATTSGGDRPRLASATIRASPFRFLFSRSHVPARMDRAFLLPSPHPRRSEPSLNHAAAVLFAERLLLAHFSRRARSTKHLAHLAVDVGRRPSLLASLDDQPSGFTRHFECKRTPCARSWRRSHGER